MFHIQGVFKTPEFKVPEGNGNERRDSNVSISILDMKKFRQIKGYLAFKSGKDISNQEVMSVLLETWIVNNRGVLGVSN